VTQRLISLPIAHEKAEVRPVKLFERRGDAQTPRARETIGGLLGERVRELRNPESPGLQ
jgi:hypothetical protein